MKISQNIGWNVVLLLAWNKFLLSWKKCKKYAIF